MEPPRREPGNPQIFAEQRTRTRARRIGQFFASRSAASSAEQLAIGVPGPTRSGARFAVTMRRSPASGAYRAERPIDDVVHSNATGIIFIGLGVDQPCICAVEAYAQGDAHLERSTSTFMNWARCRGFAWCLDVGRGFTHHVDEAIDDREFLAPKSVDVNHATAMKWRRAHWTDRR